MRKFIIAGGIAMFAFYGCEESTLENSGAANQEFRISLPDALRNGQSNARSVTDIAATLNNALFAESDVKISDIHICKLTSADAVTSVETLDKQFQSTLPSRWVTNDTRRNWNGDGVLNDLDWMAFPFFATANESINALPTYRSMYSKWETGGSCKTLDIDETTYDLSMENPSLILGIGDWAPAGVPLADVSVLGFLPASIFEAVFGEPNILGVAFSFVFVDENGNPIKTTRGKEDKAYTEVWFNDGFSWSQGVAPGKIDIASVVLHEFGHTLNLGHFGILQAFNNEDGTTDLVYQPVNTMNAFYIGQPRDFLGPNDKGNYCEAWGSWPWN